MSDEKDKPESVEDTDPQAIPDSELTDVHGGRSKGVMEQRVKQVGSANDTIFGGVSDDKVEGFNIGMPPMKGFNIGMPPMKR